MALHENPVVEMTVGRPCLTVVLVHGRWLDASHMAALAKRIDLTDIRFVFPIADNNTWYPRSFLAPLQENEPDLTAAVAHYETIVASLIASGTDARKIVVGGFSQGACLTAEFLARHPRRYGAAIMWTGGRIGPSNSDWAPCTPLAGMQAYVTTSDSDPFVPPWRVSETVQWLAQSDADVRKEIFIGRPHCVSDAEVAAARMMLLHCAAS